MTLPAPYFERDGVVLYHGDARDLLPHLLADAVVTDPPYGIGMSGMRRSRKRKGYDDLGWDSSRPDDELIRATVDAAPTAIVWGGNYFADLLPPTRGWLIWDKAQSIRLADAELAWTNLDQPIRRKCLPRVALAWEGTCHPTQKPVDLMRWCLSFTDGVVLDPFAGSGSTLVAAKIEGRPAIGVEREERYCELAAKRLAQGVLAFDEVERE